MCVRSITARSSSNFVPFCIILEEDVQIVNRFYAKWYKMTQKRRGRPRTYNPDAALSAALNVFWEHGFSGASLDNISAATGMNRPSLYAAFGDKKSLYRKSLDRFTQEFLSGLEATLFAGVSLCDDLVNFYLTALSVYQSGKKAAYGCPLICTATTEAMLDDELQSDLANSLDRIDLALVTRFEQAREQGQLRQSAEPKKLGQLAGAMLHSLAVRVRAQQTGFDPEAFIRDSVAEILKTAEI